VPEAVEDALEDEARHLDHLAQGMGERVDFDDRLEEVEAQTAAGRAVDRHGTPRRSASA